MDSNPESSSGASAFVNATLKPRAARLMALAAMVGTTRDEDHGSAVLAICCVTSA